MKRLSTIGLFGLGLLFTNNVSAQAFEEGNIGIDVYYGTPTIFQRVFKVFVNKIIDSIPNSNLEYQNRGPVGIRFEYMVASKIGVGLDVGYNSFRVTNDRVETIHDSSTNSSQKVTYRDEIYTSKIGVMGTVNFHLIDDEKFDLAAVVGIGYGLRKIGAASNDPTFNDKKYEYTSFILPVALKAGFEARYFFTPNIGLNLGLGLGQGGIAHGGLSFKF